MKPTNPAALAVFLTVALCGIVSAMGQAESFPLDPDGFYDTTRERFGSEPHLCFGGVAVHRCPYCCDPVWYVQVDTLFLGRTKPRNIKLVEQQDVIPAPPRGQRPAMLTTRDLPFDYEAGPRITIGRALDACSAIAVTYYGLQHWQSSAALTSIANPANLTFPFDSDTISTPDNTYNISNFDGAADVAISYTSKLHNVEVNYLVNHDWAVTRLIGLRFLNLTESFDYRSTETNDETSDYLVDTQNNLIGFQLGGIYGRQVTEQLSWDFEFNAGLYANITQQRTWLADVDNTRLLRNFVTDRGELAFVGELRLGMIYQLSRCWAVTAGYQITWVEGVALAPEQLDFTTTPTSGQALYHNGSVFYNGGYVGVGVNY